MTRTVRRLVLSTIGIGCAGALGAIGWLAVPALAVGAGHKAKVLCSGVLVSKRPSAAVLADLQTDDLSVLRFVNASVDAATQTVTTRALGVERRAVHRQGLGCALELDNLTPPAAPPTVGGPGTPMKSSGSGQMASAAIDVAHQFNAELDRVVARAFEEPNPRYLRRTRAIIVMHRGAILAERYAAGVTGETPLAGWSMSKSVMNALVGALVHEGRLAVEAPAPIQAWQQPGDPRARITLDHLLHMSSGLLPRRALFDPIGMSSAVLETDAAGTFIGSSYAYATARDGARFGMLYLRDGVWNEARILPRGWVDYTRTPATADGTRRYGAHFWLEIPFEFAGADARLPAPALHAVGHEAQFVTIVPSRDLVIVRLGGTRYPQAWDHAAFVRGVLAAVD